MANTQANVQQMRIEMEQVRQWLTRYLLQQIQGKVVGDIRDRIFTKAVKKIGLSILYEFTPEKLVEKLPGVKLAKMVIFAAKWMTYDGYFNTNGNFNWNPYDPKDDEDLYAEYLIFSWAMGKPGYIYATYELGKSLRH